MKKFIIRIVAWLVAMWIYTDWKNGDFDPFE
jgi:hypothetical protein